MGRRGPPTFWCLSELGADRRGDEEEGRVVGQHGLVFPWQQAGARPLCFLNVASFSPWGEPAASARRGLALDRPCQPVMEPRAGETEPGCSPLAHFQPFLEIRENKSLVRVFLNDLMRESEAARLSSQGLRRHLKSLRPFSWLLGHAPPPLLPRGAGLSTTWEDG